MYWTTEMTQVVFLALIFLFSGFVAYLNYKIEMHLVTNGQYKRVYKKSSDIKFGMLMMTIGVATGVSLLITGKLYTTANLGFFIPSFAGLVLVITSFVEEDDKNDKKTKKKK